MSEILKIAQYFFAIPSNNSNCERIFSFINIQWTDERNQLKVETVRDMTIVKYNFKSMLCCDFQKYLQRPENVKVLRDIGSAAKYNA